VIARVSGIGLLGGLSGYMVMGLLVGWLSPVIPSLTLAPLGS